MPYTITLVRASEVPDLPERDQHVADYMRGSCQKCGRCCEHVDCPALDTVTHLCNVYPNRPVVCRRWPISREHIALTNCPGFHYTESS